MHLTMQLIRLAYAICLIVHAVWASSEDPPVVTTSQGRIVGTRLQFSPTDPELHRSVDAYLNIPYAEPPVGSLRFKPPVAKSWSGEIQATELGPRCPQPRGYLNRNLPEDFSEDCLSLAVFVPQPVPSNAAVLVFIHGGGFVILAGEEAMYGDRLAAVGDVIVVLFNYRLGALGYLSTDDDVVPGNMGMLDQRLALEWVRDNIQAFGGDPERVAIFGESAGSASVSLHMISPGSAGLFRGAIMESGDAISAWATTPGHDARKKAFALGKLVGCERETSQELLDCLQALEDYNKIIENQADKLFPELGETPASSLLFVPVVDGSFLPGHPADLYEKGAINDAVSIIGQNADEGMLLPTLYSSYSAKAPFLDSITYDYFAYLIISAEPIVAAAVKLMYGNAACKDLPGCDYLETLTQAWGDMSFTYPADQAARAFTKVGRKVYRYHMTHAPTTPLWGQNWTKVNHGAELQFVFGVPLVPSDEYEFTEDEVRMALQTIKYWSNLAKTGNPNLPSLDANLTNVEWPLFTVEELAYKDLSPAMLNGRAIKAKECLFWSEFIPKLAEEAKGCNSESSAIGTKDGGGCLKIVFSFLLLTSFFNMLWL